MRKTKLAAVSVAALFGVAVFGPLFIDVPTVSAASPGCYAKNGDKYSKQPNSACDGQKDTSGKTMLPTEKCYVANIYGSAPLSAKYKETKCSSFKESAPNGCYARTNGTISKQPNSACEGLKTSDGTKINTANGCFIADVYGSAPISAKYEKISCSKIPASAYSSNDPDGDFVLSSGQKADTCGAGDQAVGIAINIGCRGQGNAIADMAFAFIRFLSNGAGIVIIASIVWAGIQYSMAKGDPQQASQAKERIRNSLIALLFFIFAYAILNYIIPAGFFRA